MNTFIQIILNSFVSGFILSLVAIGFSYIFLVARVFHLAHGGIYTTGAFACWWMLSKTSSWFAAIAFSFLIVIILIWIIEKTIYLPLNNNKSNQSISLIASMGLYVVIVNILALIFKNENKVFQNVVVGSWMFTIDNYFLIYAVLTIIYTILIVWVSMTVIYTPLIKNKINWFISTVATICIVLVSLNILNSILNHFLKMLEHNLFFLNDICNIFITKIQFIQLLVALTICSLLILYLTITKSNLTLQSISDDETISKVFGINTEKERTIVFIAGSLLACIAAILKTMEVGIDPQAGMSITLTAAVVAILVSRLNVIMIIAFAIALTLLQNSVEWFLDAQWKDGITFLILLLVILFRTEGIISYNLRKDRA